MTQEKAYQIIELRSSIIGKDTRIKRALPTAKKRLIGAWCFLDHIGPTVFEKGGGLDIAPHPHTGLQTFTWMIAGKLTHTDSLGYKQVIEPEQVNLMTAGFGISHTEVTPADYAGPMHAVQLWIAQPEGCEPGEREGESNFEHYPEIPTKMEDGCEYRVLVGEFSSLVSPVRVATSLLGVDIRAPLQGTQVTLPLKKKFEHGLLLLKGEAVVDGQVMDEDHLIYWPAGQSELRLELKAGAHVLLIGGEPFEAPVIIWWNLVVRGQEEIEEAVRQWKSQDGRFGVVADYPGKPLMPPEIPGKLVASR